MTSVGRVRAWHDGEGWGVIDSEVTPGGCWAHFSAVLVPGYRSLAPGQHVTFTFEGAEQDGFSFRAVEAWPVGQEPDRRAPSGPGSPGYYSTVDLTLDDEEEGS